MTLLKKHIIWVALVSSHGVGQDIHFSQTYNTPFLLNPSSCGDFDGQLRAMNSYKLQWSSVSDKPYKTFFFSSDKPFLNKKLCMGLVFFNDKAGDSEMSTSQAEFTLSTRLTAGKADKILVGLQGGYG